MSMEMRILGDFLFLQGRERVPLTSGGEIRINVKNKSLKKPFLDFYQFQKQVVVEIIRSQMGLR